MTKKDGAFSFSGVLDSFMSALGGECAMAKNVAEAADIVKGALEENILIQYDIITGLYKVRSKDGDTIYSEGRAKSLFTMVVSECIRIRSGDTPDSRSRRMNKNEIENIWELVRDSNQFDSRRDELYALPEWDGMPRIDVFMKKYFNCDCNPVLFRLFITSVIAKWDNPTTPVHYFFDFVGEAKGSGKTTLFRHLFGNRALDLKLSSRKEDLFVAAYDAGALVVLDDECNWIGKGFDQFSYDEFKSLVTTQRDTFSRKFQQPETHERAFVIVRTSNEPRTVFSADERRQIIFNIGLQANECRHWDMPDSERDQLLAEARDWYIQNGHKPYELSDEEREQTLAANVDNYDTETIEYQGILKFVRLLKSDLEFRQKYQITNAGENVVYVSWGKYAEWCADNRVPCTESRRYNRHIRFIAMKYPKLLTYYDKKKFINGQAMRVAKLETKEQSNDIPD